MKKYYVKNPFYLRGEVQHAGATVELSEEQFETLHPKEVIGREVVDDGTQLPAVTGTGESTTLDIDGFKSLSATEQKDKLAELKIEGDDSNEPKRVELYSSYLSRGAETANGGAGEQDSKAGEPDAETQTGDTTGDGTSNEGSGQDTTEV